MSSSTIMRSVLRTKPSPFFFSRSLYLYSSSLKSINIPSFSVITQKLNCPISTPIFQTRFNSTHSNSKAQTISDETRSKLTNEPEAKIYTYQDIKKLITNPDPTKILIDVREPEEFKKYAIPTSINIPYKSTPGALDLTPEEFKDIFKFEKPSKDSELIFYCLAGIRSTAAADLAQIFGYKKLGNYIGSLEDWLKYENPEALKEEPTNEGEKKATE